MFSKTITLTSTPQSVAELMQSVLSVEDQGQVGDNSNLRGNTVVQATSSNGSDVSIGSADSQDGFILAGGSLEVNKLNLNQTYLVGDGLEVKIFLFGNISFGIS